MKLVAVGSALLEAAQASQSNRLKVMKKFSRVDSKKKVLYVLPPFVPAGSDLYLSTVPSKSDDFGWHAIQKVLDIIGRHSNYTFIIKLEPVQGKISQQPHM